tara:strand:+ start:430 stop:654 length:225 start_codon:yes stop_codon:yes gene_type:complete
MSAKTWMYIYITGSAFLFWFLYAGLHQVKSEQMLIEYQVGKIQETLNLHTEKLEILVGSQYEMHSKLDKLIKEK